MPSMGCTDQVHLCHELEACKRIHPLLFLLLSSSVPGGKRKSVSTSEMETEGNIYLLLHIPYAGMGTELTSICSSHTDHSLESNTGDWRSIC